MGGLIESLFDTREDRGGLRSIPSLLVQSAPLLTATVVIVLVLGALCTTAGSVIGLINFRDVGYPDSANLLRVGDLVRSGRMYPDFQRPPYQLSVYAPLTYVLHGVGDVHHPGRRKHEKREHRGDGPRHRLRHPPDDDAHESRQRDASLVRQPERHGRRQRERRGTR